MPQVTASQSLVTQEPVSFPLSERGLYWTGRREYTLLDEGREREIKLKILYPALKQTNSEGNNITLDAVPDMSSAPYPLILTGPDSGEYLFKSHLASHGFVMAIVSFPTTAVYRWDYDMIDNARDLLFVIDQIATYPPEGLEGVIDSDHVGVAGYSGEGSTAFAVSGARIDPIFYQSHCEQVPDLYPGVIDWNNYACNISENWDGLASLIGYEFVSEEGLWQAITDERIRAVISMAAACPWMYGDKGLESVDLPVLIISPTNDEYDPHEMVTYIYQHIGNPKKVMISFIGKGHMMVMTTEQVKRMNHFATAFFGYYLQDRDDYVEYFSEDFVAQFDDLAWGVYSDE